MKEIEQIVLTLDKVFKDIEFDLESKKFGDGSTKWIIYVSDINFYLNDEKFKKWKIILRKKYPKAKWFCAYQANKF